MTDAELIARLGLALFGEAPGWQARLADALGVSQRNASRWCRGLLEPPAGCTAPLNPRRPISLRRAQEQPTARGGLRGWLRQGRSRREPGLVGSQYPI